MRNIAIILAAVLAVSVYGCGKKEEASTVAPQPAVSAAPVTEQPTAPQAGAAVEPATAPAAADSK